MNARLPIEIAGVHRELPLFEVKPGYGLLF